MQNSSAFCRSQELLQNKRADETSLVNVQSIARKAAAMWAIEAVAAEQREARHRKRSTSDETADQVASENPDRGLADKP